MKPATAQTGFWQLHTIKWELMPFLILRETCCVVRYKTIYLTTKWLAEKVKLSKSDLFLMLDLAYVTKLRLWEQPGSPGELWQGVDCGHCQRVPVVRARLTEIHAGFPQTQSLRLDRDAGGPTGPGPVTVISPSSLRSSRSTWEALPSQRRWHRNLCGCVLLLNFHSGERSNNRTFQREKWNTGRGWGGELIYIVVPCQRLCKDSILMSVSRPADLSSIHPFDHQSIYYLSSISHHLYPASTLLYLVICEAVCACESLTHSPVFPWSIFYHFVLPKRPIMQWR